MPGAALDPGIATPAFCMVFSGEVVWPMGRRRCRVVYRGQVQGVGFRWTTRRLAARFAVTGFVRNLSAGDVELVVEGEQEEVVGLLGAIDGSSLGPGITDRRAEWTEARGDLAAFEIRL